MENLLLEHMKAIRSDVADIKRDVRDIKVRITSLEERMVQLYGDVFHHGVRLDELNARIDRIERRLELQD